MKNPTLQKFDVCYSYREKDREKTAWAKINITMPGPADYKRAGTILKRNLKRSTLTENRQEIKVLNLYTIPSWIM